MLSLLMNKEISVSEMRKEISCAQCGQIDQVAKVTAIYDSGTTRSSYDESTSGSISGSSRSYSGTTTVTGISQTDLAAKLSPPAKPRNGGPEYIVAGISVILTAVVAAIVIGYLVDSPTLRGELDLHLRALLALFRLVPLFVGGAGIFVLIREVPRLWRKFKQDMIQWREDMASWDKTYYCARCDIKFIPGEDYFYQY